jgi:hypothetical protein
MKKRILSLDGGGSWAILQAMALKEIYKDTYVTTNCGKILEQFDVVVANSGGSLMLAAMLVNKDKDIDEVIRLFNSESVRRSVFSALTFWERREWVEKLVALVPFLKSLKPKYKSSRKETGLLDVKALGEFGKTPFSGLYNVPGYEKIAKNLVVCGFDYDRNRAYFFRTNDHSPSSGSDSKYVYRLVDVVNAASNAPVSFFDGPVSFNLTKESVHRFWDGAIGGNNNPVLIGLTETLALFNEEGITPKDIEVLSIGTGNNLLPIRGYSISDETEHEKLIMEKVDSSLSVDIPKMAKSIISEPPDAANYMAHIFLGGGAVSNSEPRIIRLNPLVQPQLSTVDNIDKWIIPKGILIENEKDDFIKLIDLDMDAINNEEVERIQKLGNWWINGIVVNQSIRAKSFDLSCDIGHATFLKGKMDWLRRCEIV